MTGTDLLQMTDDLEAYLAEFDDCFGRVETRQHLRRFARGQLGPIERKSLEPIADAEGINPRRLQFFFSTYEWDEEAALNLLQHKVAQEYGGTDGIFLIDETSDAKKGMWTAGVAPQYCGESGKIDNCIVSVHLGYVRDDFHTLLDGELFLPECWNPNPQDPGVTTKRKRARVPDDVVHESKPRMALRQLKHALENGVPGRYLTADELYGAKPWWRHEVDAMGLVYVVEVPKNIYGWVGEIAGEAQRLDALAATDRRLRCGRKKRFRTHETEKGPEVWECRKVTFYEQAKAAPKKPQQLLVAINVRTREVKYFLANASDEMTIEQLLRIAFSRWRIERCFEDCKGELGMNHAELRTYRGLRRHFILTAINYFFLQDWLLRHQRGEKRINRCAVRRRGTGTVGAADRRHHDSPPVTACRRALGRSDQSNARAQSRGARIGQTTTNTAA